jgi:hypothetical protein
MPKFRVHLKQRDVEEAFIMVDAPTRAEAMDLAYDRAWRAPDGVPWRWTETGTLEVVDAVELPPAKPPNLQGDTREKVTSDWPTGGNM